MNDTNSGGTRLKILRTPDLSICFSSYYDLYNSTNICRVLTNEYYSAK